MTIRYVDASMPDDNGDGTFASPKKYPRSALFLCSAGDEIWVKTGYCYAPSVGSFLFFSGISNIKVKTYGTASGKPIFDGLTYQNPGVSGWTYINSGVWKKTFGSFYIRRLWVGSTSFGDLVSQRILGTAKRRAYGPSLTGTTANPSEATIVAGLSSTMIWFGGGSTTSYALYVYTGSASIDPPTYYDGIAFLQTDGPGVGKIGSPSGIHVQNQTGIYVRDLHIRGVNWGFRLLAQNSDSRDVSNCLFEDCTVTAPYQSAFKSVIAGEASPTHFIRGVTARRIYCDYWASADETEPDQNYDNLSGISDNFCIADGSVGIVVQDCTSINAAHQGIVAGSLAMRTTPPSGCRFINNHVQFSSWSAYGRGMSNYDGDTLFRGNLIYGQNTRSQFAGSAKVIGNIWTNMRDSVRKPDVAEWIACESYMVDLFTSGIGSERYLRVQPTDVLIAHNTVYAPFDPCISFNYYTISLGEADNSFSAGAVTVKNNIVHSPQSTFVRTYEDSGKVIGQQTFANNCVFDGSSGNNKITWRGSSYTINAAPGCSANVEANPVLSPSHRPSAASVVNSGIPIEGRDYYGLRLRATPNIGAVDATPGARFTFVRLTDPNRTVTVRPVAPHRAAS